MVQWCARKLYVVVNVKLGVAEIPRLVDGPIVVVVEVPPPFPTEPPELKARVVFAARAHWMPPMT